MASRRVLIVGGVAGGAACAARLRRLDESAEIVVFERGGHVSFANCGLPYYVGNVITKRDDLLVASPERFRDLFNVQVQVRHEVVSIDRQARTVEVKDLEAGTVGREPYDVLVLSPGARPVRPELPGIDLPGIFTLRNLEDADRLRQWIQGRRAERALVVGGGFIGLEMAENLHRRGIHVTLLELLDQVLAPMDPEMVTPLHEHLKEKGVDLRLRNGVAGFDGAADGKLVVRAQRGEQIPADVVVLAIGVRPEVTLARQAGLEIGQLGGIRVDDQLRTSDPAILAVGDAVEVRDWVTGQWSLVPLAGPASRQGRIAADVIAGRPARFRGVQGTAVVGVFELTAAITGASEKRLRQAAMPYEKIYVHPADHASYYPGAKRMALKLLFAPDSGRLLGAQAVGAGGVDKRIDVLAMAIQKQATVYDLEEAELCYAPQYGNARDPVNMAGFVAGNVLRGDVQVAHWEQWRERRQQGRLPVVIDVRPPKMVAKGAVPGTVNIPLPQLRGRLDQLPRDQEIWVHCMVGQSSYYATRILAQHGFQVRNLAGGITSYKMQGAE